jgi:hypothetical protein
MDRAPKVQKKTLSVDRRPGTQRDWHKEWESRVLHVFLISGLVLTLGRVLLDDVQRLYVAVEEIIFRQPTPGKSVDTPVPDRRSALNPNAEWNGEPGQGDHGQPIPHESADSSASLSSMNGIPWAILSRVNAHYADVVHEWRITSTSPSLTIYSFPSRRSRPFSRTPG